jgi:hypothetical protein
MIAASNARPKLPSLARDGDPVLVGDLDQQHRRDQLVAEATNALLSAGALTHAISRIGREAACPA